MSWNNMFLQTLVFALAVVSSTSAAQQISPAESEGRVDARSYYPPYGVYPQFPQFGQYPGYIPINYPGVITAATAATTTTTTTTGRPLQPGVVTAYPLGAGQGFQRPGNQYLYPGQPVYPGYPFYGRK